MKRLIPLFAIPLMISCVSQKKYAALEEQCTIKKEYEAKLDLLVNNSADQQNQMKRELLELMKLNQEDFLVNLKEMVADFSNNGFPDINTNQLMNSLVESSQNISMTKALEEYYNYGCELASKARIEFDIMSEVVQSQISKDYPEIISTGTGFSCETNIPISLLFDNENNISESGLKILQKMNELISIKEAFMLTIELPISNSGISSSNLTYANKINEYFMGLKKQNSKPLNINFKADTPQDQAVFIVKY